MSNEATLMTDEELMQLPDDGYKYEYIGGELEASPAGMLHESIAVKLILKLGEFLKNRESGKVYSTSVQNPGCLKVNRLKDLAALRRIWQLNFCPLLIV